MPRSPALLRCIRLIRITASGVRCRWSARYAELNIDNAAFPAFANLATSASAAEAWSAGLNWFLNKNIRVNASFSHTTFTGGGGAGTTAPAIVTRQPENVFFTRLQLSF